MSSIKNLVRPNILSLMPYTSARDEFSGKKGTFLDANENPYGTLNRYPDPYQKELKDGLASLKKTSAENIFIGNGSDEVIDLALRIFCVPAKDKVLTFSPTYGMYEVSAAINDIELIKIPLTEEFQIDLKSVESYLSDASIKIIFICSPNNPSGNSINNDDIKYILNRYKGIVIIDEAYIDFSPHGSWISLLPNYPNLIISQTFSKAWGLAAARIGTAYASNEVITLYNRVKPPYNVSELNQKAASEVLNNWQKVESQRQAILEEKSYMIKELKKLVLVKKIYPSDANFILIEVADVDRLYEDLLNEKIITRNRNSVVRNCLRITIGTGKENKLLLAALKNIES